MSTRNIRQQRRRKAAMVWQPEPDDDEQDRVDPWELMPTIPDHPGAQRMPIDSDALQTPFDN